MSNYRRPALGRKRSSNMLEPHEGVVAVSVVELVHSARAMAQRDHRGSLATDRELDLVAEVYLQRALNKLRGYGPEEEQQACG